MDIFISYKKERALYAKRLAAILEAHGYEVWWDYELAVGPDFRDQIERNLDKAKCVLVLWCSASVRSKFVRSEANRAEKRGKLIQSYLEWVEPPLGFDEAQGHSLVHWRGEPSGEAINRLIVALEDIIGTRKKLPNILRLIEESSSLQKIEPIEVEAEELIEETKNNHFLRPAKSVSAKTQQPSESHSLRRWLMISDSRDHRDYEDFLDVFPKDPEAFEAKRHYRQIKDWQSIDQSDINAVATFISETDNSSQLFLALREHVFRRLQLIESKDFKEQQERQLRIDDIKRRAVDVVVPALGESVTKATMGMWLVAKGEHVEPDQVLVELETDKVAIEIHSGCSGEVLEIFFDEGTELNIGDKIARILPDK